MASKSRLAVSITIAFVIGATASAARAYHLAGTAGLAGDAYWISLMCGGTKAAEGAGSTIDWYPVKSTSAAEAQANFDAVKIANPDGVVLSAFATDPPVGYLEDLMGRGIPVVYVNGQPPKERDYLTGYSSAPADSKMAAVADMIVANSGGAGTMSVLGGVPSQNRSFTNRWTILVDMLRRQAPNLHILDTQYDKFDANKSNEIVSAQMVANPDLKIVYTVSGPEGQGAAAAVKAAGKSGQVLVYSFDAVPLLQAGIRDGTVKALVAQPPRPQGQRAVLTLIAYLNAHKDHAAVKPDTEHQNQPIDTMIITKENIDSAAAQDYLYKDTCR